MGKSVFDKIDTIEEYRKLREAIKKSGFTNKAVCLESGMHPTTISGWNSGKKIPSAAKLNSLKTGLKRLIEKKEKELKGIK